MSTAEDNKSSSSGEDESKKKDDDDSDEIVEIPVIKPDEQPKSSRHYRESILSDEMKFMQDFDEKNSLRRQRKNRRRFYADGRPIINADDYEDCDCLRPNCPGCHYPCPRCGDGRCGKECRNGRRWLYETIETEGILKVLKNRHIDSFGYQDYD